MDQLLYVQAMLEETGVYSTLLKLIYKSFTQVQKNFQMCYANAYVLNIVVLELITIMRDNKK